MWSPGRNKPDMAWSVRTRAATYEGHVMGWEENMEKCHGIIYDNMLG